MPVSRRILYVLVLFQFNVGIGQFNRRIEAIGGSTIPLLKGNLREIGMAGSSLASHRTQYVPLKNPALLPDGKILYLASVQTVGGAKQGDLTQEKITGQLAFTLPVDFSKIAGIGRLFSKGRKDLHLAFSKVPSFGQNAEFSFDQTIGSSRIESKLLSTGIVNQWAFHFAIPLYQFEERKRRYEALLRQSNKPKSEVVERVSKMNAKANYFETVSFGIQINGYTANFNQLRETSIRAGGNNYFLKSLTTGNIGLCDFNPSVRIGTLIRYNLNDSFIQLGSTVEMSLRNSLLLLNTSIIDSVNFNNNTYLNTLSTLHWNKESFPTESLVQTPGNFGLGVSFGKQKHGDIFQFVVETNAELYFYKDNLNVYSGLPLGGTDLALSVGTELRFPRIPLIPRFGMRTFPSPINHRVKRNDLTCGVGIPLAAIGNLPLIVDAALVNVYESYSVASGDSFRLIRNSSFRYHFGLTLLSPWFSPRSM